MTRIQTFWYEVYHDFEQRCNIHGVPSVSVLTSYRLKAASALSYDVIVVDWGLNFNLIDNIQPSES